MNAHDLIEKLGKYPPAAEVMLATDEEGNDFLHTHAVEKGFIRTDYDELVPADDTEYVDDLRRDHVELIPAVVLWP